MRWIMSGAVMGGILVSRLSSPAQAASPAAGLHPDRYGVVQQNEADERALDRSFLFHERFAVRPEIGAVLYSTRVDVNEARPAMGLRASFNVTPWLGEPLPGLYLGVASGFLYSHLGPESAGFFGGGSGVGADSNLFLVPINLTAGYTFGSRFRLAFYGGASLLHRSNGFSMAVSRERLSAGAETDAFPNIGADIVVAIGRDAAVTFRPDLIVTDGQDVFTGTFGISFPLL